MCACLAAWLAACLPGWGHAGTGRPYFLKAQFAGGQGLVSLGAGRAFLGGRIDPDLAYGYVPEWAGGTAVHVFSQTTTFRPFPTADLGSLHIIPGLAGYSAMLGVGDRYFLYRKKFAGYYWPSALRFRFFAGTGIRTGAGILPGTAGMEGILQIGAGDADLQACLSNRGIGLGDVLTAALSWNVYLGNGSPPRL